MLNLGLSALPWCIGEAPLAGAHFCSGGIQVWEEALSPVGMRLHLIYHFSLYGLLHLLVKERCH